MYDNLRYRPDVICESGFHRGGDARRLVDSAAFVVHEVKRHGPTVIVALLGKRIRKTREPAHFHPHSQVLALRGAGRSVS
jgi:hypothetical protein